MECYVLHETDSRKPWAAGMLNRLLARVSWRSTEDKAPSELTCSKQLLVAFTLQFATLLGAGIHIQKSLTALGEQFEEDPGLQRAVREVCLKVETGVYLSQAMSHYSGIFNRAFVSMVKVGESGGRLVVALARLAAWLERDYQTYHRVRSALAYPAFVLTLGSVLGFSLFYFVMPAVIGVFASFQMPLPTITKLMVVLTQLVSHPLAWLAGAGVATETYLILNHQWKTVQGRLTLYRCLTLMPGLGPLLEAAALSRFCSAYASLLEVGINQPTAWKLSATVSGSPEMESDIPRIMECYRNGDALPEVLAERPEVYPQLFVQMLNTGQESGRLAKLVSQSGLLYEQDMDHRINILSALFEPLLLAVVSFAVGMMVLAVCLPLYGLLAQFSQ